MYYPKSQQSTIQDLLYPKQLKKMNFSQHKRNMDFLKYVEKKIKKFNNKMKKMKKEKIMNLYIK